MRSMDFAWEKSQLGKMPKEIYDPEDSNMCITMHVNCLTVAVAVAVAVAVTETDEECCLQSVSPSAGFTTCAC